jgi:hypothetical protein
LYAAEEIGVIPWNRDEKQNLMDYVQMADDGGAVWQKCDSGESMVRFQVR